MWQESPRYRVYIAIGVHLLLDRTPTRGPQADEFVGFVPSTHKRDLNCTHNAQRAEAWSLLAEPEAKLAHILQCTAAWGARMLQWTAYGSNHSELEIVYSLAASVQAAARGSRRDLMLTREGGQRGYNTPTPALCRSGFTWPEVTIK